MEAEYWRQKNPSLLDLKSAVGCCATFYFKNQMLYVPMQQPFFQFRSLSKNFPQIRPWHIWLYLLDQYYT